MQIKLTAFFTALFMLVFSVPSYRTERPEYYRDTINSQVEYIKELSQADGSVTMSRPVYDPAIAAMTLPTVNGVSGDEYKTWKSSKVCPYFSCISLIGALETSPEQGRIMAEKYIDWHFAHLNNPSTDCNSVDATIYDYRLFVDPSDSARTVCVSEHEIFGDGRDYDSTDSYAALFLKLLQVYSEAFPDSDFLNGRSEDVQRVATAILSTYVGSLDLTTAKPGYDICYLMDNCEVYEGLICASNLFKNVFKNQNLSASFSEMADDVKSAINRRMYNPLAGAYYASIGADGRPSSSVSSSALPSFYPEGTSQLFVILSGIIEPDSLRARFIYERFNLYFGTDEAGKNWSALDVGASFPWALVVRAAVMMNDGERVESYFDSVQTRFFEKNCPYPYYCAEAGHILSAAAQLLGEKG